MKLSRPTRYLYKPIETQIRVDLDIILLNLEFYLKTNKITFFKTKILKFIFL